MPAAYDAIIGLGSNIGDKVANIARAVELLSADGDVRQVGLSRIYRTAPWGVVDQDWFANACATVATELSARDLLKRCQLVETTMRRVRDRRWGPRIIDVDVLAYRREKIADADLVVPHPGISERPFVLIPLRDVAPGFMLDGRSIDAMLSTLDANDVVPIDQ